MLATVTILAFWSVLITGQRSFFIFPDNVAQAYPWYQKLASSIHHGYLPLWDANVNAGNSFVGENQTGVFYPLNLVVAALFGTPLGIPIWALEALTVVHFFLAAWGTYLFCRRLRCSASGSFYAAVVFSLLGPHANRAMAQTMIFYTYSLLPFAAYFALCFVQTKHYKHAAAAGFVVALSISAGHFAAPFMTCLVCAAILVSGFRTQTFDRLLTGSAIFVVTVLVVASPQLFFVILHFTTSYRIVGTPMPQLATAKIPLSAVQQFALEPSGLLSLFDPMKFSGGVDGNGLFLGIMPLVAFALLITDSSARSSLRQSLRKVGALYALAGLAIVLSLGVWTIVGRLWYSIPGFATVVREPGRYILIAQFVFSIGLAIAVDGFMRNRRTEPRHLSSVIGMLAVIGYSFYIVGSLSNLTQSLWLVAVTLVAFALVTFTRVPAQFATLTLVVAGTLEAILAAAQLPQPVTAATYAPTAYHDRPAFHFAEACFPTCRMSFEGTENFIPANIGDVYQLQSIWGYTALIDRAYLDFEQSDSAGSGFVLDVLNVRYIATSTTRPPPMVLVSADETQGLYVYERPSYFPRVFSLDAALQRNRARNDVVFSVETYNDLDQRYVVTIPRDEIVVFSELYYPGWNLRVDTKPVQISVAGIRSGPPILRAVSLSRGKHLVEFRYL
jgi:hypothetical protein